MDSNITLIGSIVIGGIFLLGILSFHGGVVDYSHNRTFELLTQETTASFMEIITYDFQRIGSRVSSPALAIVAADTSSITFLGDVDDDGNVETVRYALSDTAAAASSENPNDRILYRIVDSDTTIGVPAGVRRFRLTLYNRTGGPPTNVMDVHMLDVLLMVESKFQYDGNYTRAIWEKRITPKSLYRIPNIDL